MDDSLSKYQEENNGLLNKMNVVIDTNSTWDKNAPIYYQNWEEDPLLIKNKDPLLIKNTSVCRKIDVTLSEECLKPRLTITFMWYGDNLYYNYYIYDQGVKKYALGSWQQEDLTDTETLNVSFIRLLYKLACDAQLNQDEQNLLMAAKICNILNAIRELGLQEQHAILNDNKAVFAFLDKLFKTQAYKDIHDRVKQGNAPTTEAFVEAMNSFFTNKQKEENKRQNNQNLNINNSTNNFNYGYDNNEKNKINNNKHDGNGYCDKCITGLENCWNSVKSCFDCG